jgi:hypothetical protein
MRRHFSLIIVLLSVTITLQAQVYQEVSRALQQGNAEGVARYFDNSVVLDLPGVEGFFSKAEAQKQLDAFFKANPPSRFVQSHSGSSQGKNSQYMIGDLSLSNGTYRVYLYFKSAGNALTLQELRIHR